MTNRLDGMLIGHGAPARRLDQLFRRILEVIVAATTLMPRSDFQGALLRRLIGCMG
jgi:hypothetical protein